MLMPSNLRFWIIFALILIFIFFLLRKYLGRILIILVILFVIFMVYRWISPSGASKLRDGIKTFPDTVTTRFTPKQKEPELPKLEIIDIDQIELPDPTLFPSDEIIDRPILPQESESIGIVASGSRAEVPNYFVDEQGNRYVLEQATAVPVTEVEPIAETPKSTSSVGLSSSDLAEADSLFNL